MFETMAVGDAILTDTGPASHDAVDERCPMVDFVNLISGKWAIPILYRLIIENRPLRFAELKRAIGRVTQKELTRYLRNFERQGLVIRTSYPVMPLHVEYQISELGQTLRPMLDGLSAWMSLHGRRVMASS